MPGGVAAGPAIAVRLAYFARSSDPVTLAAQ
jgi:hypothetical protein